MGGFGVEPYCPSIGIVPGAENSVDSSKLSTHNEALKALEKNNNGVTKLKIQIDSINNYDDLYKFVENFEDGDELFLDEKYINSFVLKLIDKFDYVSYSQKQILISMLFGTGKLSLIKEEYLSLFIKKDTEKSCKIFKEEFVLLEQPELIKKENDENYILMKSRNYLALINNINSSDNIIKILKIIYDSDKKLPIEYFDILFDKINENLEGYTVGFIESIVTNAFGEDIILNQKQQERIDNMIN